MVRLPNYTNSPWQEKYTEIIDVRSENEFTEDHLPNAINLPVLNNEERVKVGTIHKQVSPFEARKVGASLVSANISTHLEKHFCHKEKDYSPLIYCWRGGQRSQSMAMVLSQIGWNVTVIEGGYKTYRTHVREQLQQLIPKFNYKILCGLTGTGKTHILHALERQGEQVLDLEKLANHRGSLLGQEWQNKLEPQPSQKYFESLLLQTLKKFDSDSLVWVESESNKVGEIHLPSILWEQMKKAPSIEVQLPLAARVEWLLQEYPHLTKHPEIIRKKLKYLKSHRGKKKIDYWYSLIDAKQFGSLVQDLLETHYDPAYNRSMNKTFKTPEKILEIPDLSESSINLVLDKLIDI